MYLLKKAGARKGARFLWGCKDQSWHRPAVMMAME